MLVSRAGRDVFRLNEAGIGMYGAGSICMRAQRTITAKKNVSNVKNEVDDYFSHLTVALLAG